MRRASSRFCWKERIDWANEKKLWRRERISEEKQSAFRGEREKGGNGGKDVYQSTSEDGMSEEEEEEDAEEDEEGCIAFCG